MCTNIEEEIEIDEDSMESLEKLKEKTYKSVKKEIMMLDDDGEGGDGDGDNDDRDDDGVHNLDRDVDFKLKHLQRWTDGN